MQSHVDATLCGCYPVSLQLHVNAIWYGYNHVGVQTFVFAILLDIISRDSGLKITLDSLDFLLSVMADDEAEETSKG